MGVSTTALGATARAADRVVIVGAGPSGMATAIELAQSGIRSTVLEARGEVASRRTLFNVVPAFADRLAALAPDGSLTKQLVPTSRIDVRNLTSGRVTPRTFVGAITADPRRGRGDLDAVLNAVRSAASSTADLRRWSKVGIGDLENAMRSYAALRHADMIDLRYDAKVVGISQDALGASASVAGAHDAVRGAMLVDASGRDLLGAERTVYPEQAHWLGGIYPRARTEHAGADGFAVERIYAHDGPAGPDGIAGTMALHHDDRTIVWTELDRPGAQLDPDAARALLAARAPLVGVTETLPGDVARSPSRRSCGRPTSRPAAASSPSVIRSARPIS